MHSFLAPKILADEQLEAKTQRRMKDRRASILPECSIVTQTGVGKNCTHIVDVGHCNCKASKYKCENGGWLHDCSEGNLNLKSLRNGNRNVLVRMILEAWIIFG